jgi:hypothetical protein|tara:strand:+ start:768 stop:986 length:219 start_codon:yes stop_codon:yes gene_type:complete
MRKGKKFAIVNSYQKLCVPVEFLPKLLQVGFMVETSYEDGKDSVKSISDIEKCEFIDGEAIDLAEAVDKLSA